MDFAASPLAILIVGMMVVFAAVAALVCWRWPKGEQPLMFSPLNREPHVVTPLSPDGRPNPLSYEIFPDYPSALKRQRQLAQQGKPSVVTHTDSGQVRVDMGAWLGSYHRISF